MHYGTCIGSVQLVTVGVRFPIGSEGWGGGDSLQFLPILDTMGARWEGGRCTDTMHGRSGSHSYSTGAEDVRVSSIRQLLLVLSTKRREVFGE